MSLGSSLVRFPSFLFLCLSICIPYSPCPHVRSPLGLPGFFVVSLPACHGLWTPADLHILAKMDASVLPSVKVKTLGVRNLPFRSCSSTSGCAITPTAYRILCLRLVHLVRLVSRQSSAMDPRLDTGGWLTLTQPPLGNCARRELSPR